METNEVKARLLQAVHIERHRQQQFTRTTDDCAPPGTDLAADALVVALLQELPGLILPEYYYLARRLVAALVERGILPSERQDTAEGGG